MGREAKLRKALSMPGLLAEMWRCFEAVEDTVWKEAGGPTEAYERRRK